MLLGIGLHAALSFTPIPWAVQDTQQSGVFLSLFAFIHGFRMPLFFVLSGFFTAMLWRKRGPKYLAMHRFKRIFLPLVFGCLTIVPSMWAVSQWVARPASTDDRQSDLFTAVVTGDVELVRRELNRPQLALDVLDSNYGSSPLCTAVFLGHTEIVQLLVEAKADPNLPNRDKTTPLHVAAFLGRAEEARLLIAAGADATTIDGNGSTPVNLLSTDVGTTQFIAKSMGVQLDESQLLAGRRDIAAQLGGAASVQSESLGQTAVLGSWDFLLFQMPVFMHLWFLWFLCWLVIVFLLYARVADAIRIRSLPRWLVVSPANLLWLIPLTTLPLMFMEPRSFGPDASIGLLPIPSVLFYYAIFFFFGAIYWEMDDRQGQLGKQWWLSLSIATLAIFPVGFDWVSGSLGIVSRPTDGGWQPLLGNLFQATFAWLMVFGLIGACRQILGRESRILRYVSDSSYWLYLAHLPVVILAQWFVRDLSYPAFVKFAAITTVVSGILLLTYEYGVRYTLIGQLLNGRRMRLKKTKVAR